MKFIITLGFLAVALSAPAPDHHAPHHAAPHHAVPHHAAPHHAAPHHAPSYHQESYEQVYRCPNYPYCDEAPHGIYHLQAEIEALRQRSSLIEKHGRALALQKPNQPFVAGLY